MSIPVTLNGITYQIPTVGEVGWGQEVTNYLVALGAGGVLTLEGGNFPLQNELNFGPAYGIASAYFRSGEDPAADDGVLRLTADEFIAWRNDTDTDNNELQVINGELCFNGAPLIPGISSPLTTKGDLYTFTTVNARQPVGLNGQALISDSSSPTGLTWTNLGGAGGGSVIGFTFTDNDGVHGTVATPTTTPNLTLDLGDITPTSVNAAGDLTGYNLNLQAPSSSKLRIETFTGGATIKSVPFTPGNVSDLYLSANNAPGTPALIAAFRTDDTGPIAFTLRDFTNADSGRVYITTGDTSTSTAYIRLSQSNDTHTLNIRSISGSVSNDAEIATNGTAPNVGLSIFTKGTSPVTIWNGLTVNGNFIAPTGVTAGSYLSANITVDASGRITSASNGSGGGGGIGSIATVPANGVISVVTNPTGPATSISIGLGNITPASIAATGTVTGSNISGTNTGDQTISLTGDVFGSGTNNINAVLANTSVSPGTYTSANITVDSKGRVTAASNGSGGGGGVSQIIAGTNVTISPVGGTGIVTINAPSSLTGLTTANHTALGVSANAGTGNGSVALGNNAGSSASNGFDNIAIGALALTALTGGNQNLAIGRLALSGNTNGSGNVAIGEATMQSVTTGTTNTAIGFGAGPAAGATSSNCVYVGVSAGTGSPVTQTNCIYIGKDSTGGANSNNITLGNSAITALRCAVTSITTLSDARDKENIESLEFGLDFIDQLYPVQFIWNSRDKQKVGIPAAGFIAQDLKKTQEDFDAGVLDLVFDVNPDRLEATYGNLIPVLVKAIQELRAEIKKLKTR